MKGKLFFLALLAGGMFFAGKAQAQDADAYRPVAQVESQYTYSRSDNYKNQFSNYRWEKDLVVSSEDVMIASRNYKHQTGANDRMYTNSESAHINRGIIPELYYKHQVPLRRNFDE